MSQKPPVPTFDGENSPPQHFNEQPEGRDPPFPPPIPPDGALFNSGDLDNYSPPAAIQAEIKCFGCRHFWHRKTAAVAWSATGRIRKEGHADCMLTTPPTPLIGQYVTDCNRFEPKP